MLGKNRGVAEAFQFWCSNLHLMPDSVIHLKDTFITVPVTGRGSKVMSTFTVEATSIYDTPLPPTDIDFMAFKPSCDDDSKTVLQSVVDTMSNGVRTLPLREYPLKIVLAGRFVMTLDDAKRITSLDFIEWTDPKIVS